MKKTLLIIICLILLFGIWQNVWAVDLLINYPTISETGPTSEGLPGLIKYIYLFSLGMVGFVALLSILIGAVRYVTAAGNTSQVEDAKEQIKQALLGILILLTAVLILRTINPDLVKFEFKLPEITPTPRPQPTKDVACHCLSAGGSSLFAGSCYLTYDECMEDCTTICENSDKVGFCVTQDIANCQININ